MAPQPAYAISHPTYGTAVGANGVDALGNTFTGGICTFKGLGTITGPPGGVMTGTLP